MARKRALILLNTSSGIGRAGTNAMGIIRRFAEKGYEPIIYPIIPGTALVAEKILPDYADNAEIVLCSGGDGTLNHVVHTLMNLGSHPKLAYIPTGSTNDFAKGIGIPVDFEKAFDTVFNGKEFSYDIGKINDRYFNYIAAFGAFSKISYDTDQQLKNVFGHAAYIVSALGQFDEQLRTSCHMRIETEDEVMEGNYAFGAICSTISVGGFPLFKGNNVRLNDGKMELLLVKAPKTALDLQEILNAAVRGTFDHPLITFRQVSEVKLYADEDTSWSLDGEFGGMHKEVHIQVLKQAVTIMSGIQK